MVKVTVLGAAGGIGQPLSLLLRLNPHVTELALFDIVNSEGVAVDLSHIPTKQKVYGYGPKSKTDTTQLKAALKDADVVVIPAGVPRKPGMTRNDLFKINASIVKGLVHQAGLVCPNAFICIISNPVNSTVPIAVEELKKLGAYNPAKVFGITTLDNLRLEEFLSLALKRVNGASIDPADLRGDAISIGGHSGSTIVPVLNSWASSLPSSVYDTLLHRVQYGGDEVVKAKNGRGSATLSMATAGYRFVSHLVEALADDLIVDEVAFIKFDELPAKGIPNIVSSQISYFSLPFKLGRSGVKFVQFPKNLSDKETKLVGIAVKQLRGEIDTGVEFVHHSKL
ncbi:DEKNAAC103530 [Brettanomyces naardenensis]|uniref:malate dehydrogenase n=1 Tax=Brettanomyces naardenensis TaxID=13370 RepID=A0A448YN56_BRENA|nr:DEKNAAC103530 [Brettanomyces naardenensis]